MDYIKIMVAATDQEMIDVLVAQLSELGFEGFEEGQGLLYAFIPEGDFDPAAVDALLKGRLHDYHSEKIPAKNWNEDWEKSFSPVVIEGFCSIRADFHPPIPGIPHDLVITPKMSFGTGHHATTYMMLEAMQKLDFSNKDVLDFGTGTGILAILAEKLGAREVWAIDHDEACIVNTRENMVGNQCRQMVPVKMDAIPHNKLFFIILANINKSIILTWLGAMEQQLDIGGVIILSGLLPDDQAAIEQLAVRHRLTISDRMTKNDWLCLRLERAKTKESVGN